MATATSPVPSVQATRAQIDEFLKNKRVAFVGVSRHPQDFTRSVMKEFVKRGYEVVPVHPHCKEIGGHTCYGRVQDIPTPIAAALLFTTPKVTEHVVRDCASAGIRHVWMHKGGGPGAVSLDAVAFCWQQHINVIAGECPNMFLPGAAWFHRAHGLIHKVFGCYPE